MWLRGSGIETTAPEAEPDRVKYDEIFELLSNHRRRYVLHHLRRTGEGVDLGTLAERIAAWENGTSLPEVSADERKRVYSALQQVHLPRLDETGVVEFDDRAGTVELGPAAENLDVYMEVVEGRDIPWSQYYSLLAVMNAVIVGAAYVGVPPLATLPGIATGVFAVTTFCLSAVFHAYYDRTEMRIGANERPIDT